MPLLSITIPTYTRGQRLSELLWGICTQIEALPENLKPEVDVWVNDNASTDDTGFRVQKYQARYPFLNYARNEANLGADQNMLLAIERPQGQFLWLMCDDDLPAQKAIERLLKHLHYLEKQLGHYNLMNTQCYL